MTLKTTRRRFVEITPLAGLALLAACSPPPPPAAPAPSAAPADPPSPAPAPAPAAEAPPPAAETPAAGAELPLADESSPNSVALGYVSDASRVDTARHPTFVAGSNCANCALYLGAPGSEAGPCPLFPGQRVAAEGWCSAWARKG
jgi:hypothetical protein